MDDETVQEKIDQALASQREAHEADIQGLKNKNSELLGKLKESKEALSRWDGLDPDDVKSTMEQVRKNREITLLKDGKIEEAYGERVNLMQKEHEAILSARDEQIEKLTKELGDTQAAYSSKIIDDEVLRHFVEAGGRKEAVDDVLLRAKTTFKINEGKAVAYDGDTPVADEDGLVGPQKWVAGLKESAPHLWPESQGANATGVPRNTDLTDGSEIQKLVSGGGQIDMDRYRELRRGSK